MKLEICLEEFKRLPQKDKFSCLYENQVKTLNAIQGYKFYAKITSVIGGFLALAMGYLFQLHLK